ARDRALRARAGGRRLAAGRRRSRPGGRGRSAPRGARAAGRRPVAGAHAAARIHHHPLGGRAPGAVPGGRAAGEPTDHRDRGRDAREPRGGVMTAKKGAGGAPEASFTEAMRELEAILARIEGEEVDLDRLASELGRAAELLELCRGKIRKAELEVAQIVQRLEPPPAGE